MPDLIAIIVTYNGEKWIGTCLDCLLKSVLQPKIIIIDNASTDQTKTIIKERFPLLHLIENDKNIGFGQANNIGMEYALSQGAEFVFLLNQDAYLYPDTLEKLTDIHLGHMEYGIISPLQQDGSGMALDRLFRKFISNNYPQDFVKKIESGDPDLPSVFPVRFVNAAAWLITVKCLRTTGLFNPLFYHYGEDNNYSSRAQYHGFKVGITPAAAVRHDRIYEDQGAKLLQRQIQLVPLYILLDLRKPLFTACLIVFWKMVGYSWKGLKRKSPAILRLTFHRITWFLSNFSLIRKTRKETKKTYLP